MTNKELFCSVLRAALFPQAYPMPPFLGSNMAFCMNCWTAMP